MITKNHAGVPVIPKQNIKEAAKQLYKYECLHENGNIFFLKDADENSVDAVIISLLSSNEIEEIVERVKTETEEEVFNAICLAIPEPCLIFDRWDMKAKAIWY